MGHIKWQKKMEIGVQSVDDQHKKIVGMINMLDDSISNGQGLVNDHVGTVIIELVKYTQYHFTEEERIMEEIGFSGLQAHTKLHRILVERVKKMLVGLKTGESINVFALKSFLTEWLVDHIGNEDSKIGPEAKVFYTKNKGTHEAAR